MMRNTSRGRRGLGIAMHCCSAEREDDGALNVLRRICACYIAHVYSLSTLSLTTSGWFFLVLFRKSTKNFGLAFLRVSCRRGCLKRPLRASNLVGVSAAIPTAPPFFHQKPTAEIIARTPMLCRFAERVIL